ncbi:MAG: 23S rRNA (pseudouridine(1915)-N(3))-methyltransferase RlmH, partial [Bacteroidales bacterium]|nr:23S rRNA (pseudouridine(1915)-N(3))-methyltransferase RlmH [Bacteroidales bacterium]
ISFQIEVIPAVKKQKSLSEDELKIKEGGLIMKKIVSSDFVILLDEKGREYSSVQFAEFIERHLALSGKDLIFVIGGPYGFSKDIYNRANLKISLSQLTFSHQMVRLIFMEQLYRAFTIMKGEPYHHN